jgi:sulfur relay (sulfurtransferase) DsrF/TusC family protein
MSDIVVEIGKPPFGCENTFAGLYVALVSVTKGREVTVVLRGDGVFAGVVGQEDTMENIHLPPTEQQMQDIVDLDGRVVADKASLEARGINSEDLFEEIEIVDTQEIYKILLEFGDHVINF